MKFSPSLLYQESREAKSESFDEACDKLFFENVSPNIFHLLFKNKKNNSFEKKFEIFIDLITLGADLSKELVENKNLKSELINFFELESDSEATKYFENRLLFKLKEFKSQLQLIPSLEKIPHSKNLYIKSINYLQKIASFYENQLKDSDTDLLCAEKFFSRITQEDFFSKEQTGEIEHILNFMGFLIYLKDSKFIDFIYEKSEQYMKIRDAEMLPEEKEIYNSINILIETLPDCFDLFKNQQIHYAKIEEIKNANSLEFLALRNKFLISIKGLLDDQITKRELEKEVKKKDDPLKKAKEKERIKIEEKKELEREKLKAEKQRKKEEQKILKQRQDELKKEALEKIKREKEEMAEKLAQEKAEIEAKKIADKDKRREEFLAKKQAEDKAKMEAEERLKIEQERAKIEAEERLKIEQEKAKIEAEERLKIEQEKAKIEAEEVGKLITEISKKIQEDFERFNQLFDFLNNSEMWVKPCEIGFYGSRVYGPFVENIFTNTKSKTRDLSKTDYDFFCVADGVFACCYDEPTARENFENLFKKFNQKNPNFQINFKDNLGKANLNFNKFKKSLNFKLIATIDGEELEFDLNFYSKESKSQNLQWQVNPERIIFCKIEDKYEFAINQNDADQTPKIKILEFFQRMRKEENFIIDSNAEATGFLNRIINLRGIYKFPDEANLIKIKDNIVKKSCEKLIEELDRYKKFLLSPIYKDDAVYEAKKIEFETIIKGTEQDQILSKILDRKTPEIFFSAKLAKTIATKLIEDDKQKMIAKFKKLSLDESQDQFGVSNVAKR